jgi:hypothetical protein
VGRSQGLQTIRKDAGYLDFQEARYCNADPVVGIFVGKNRYIPEIVPATE